MTDLDEERPVYSFVLFLFRQPAFTQEHVNFLRVHILHLHLVEVPIRTDHGVVVANTDLEDLSQVHSLDCKLVHLKKTV